MKKILSLAVAATLALPLAASAAVDTVSWTNWSSSSTGTLQQNGNTVTVSYEGDAFDVSHESFFYNVPDSFTSAEVSNTPGAAGTLRTVGGTNGSNHFHFSAPVSTVYIDIISAGQSGHPVTFNFIGIDATQVSLPSGGPGNWGGQALTLSGTTVIGEEGNGTVKLSGTFTDVYFTTPNSEDYYGYTVGTAMAAAVPEPETYGMMLAGLGLLGIAARRRKAA